MFEHMRCCFLQERHVQNQADANTKLQEQVLELTRQLAREDLAPT